MNATTGVVHRSISSTATEGPERRGSHARERSVPLSRLGGKAEQTAGHHVAGGLVAGDEQLHEEHRELGVGQAVAVDLGRAELGDDVVPRRAARRSAAAASR